MGMTGFSDAEMALLSGLDAVAWVTRTRITYTDSFKREAVTRYRRGESPVRIFREAGLDPRIIGNKRIERCIARWKREPPDAGTTRPHAPASDAGREGRPAPMSVVLAQTMRVLLQCLFDRFGSVFPQCRQRPIPHTLRKTRCLHCGKTPLTKRTPTC